MMLQTFKKRKKKKWAAQSKLFFIVSPSPKWVCPPHVCTTSPDKTRLRAALGCFPLNDSRSLRCEGCKLWPTVRQPVTFTDQNNLSSHSRAWGRRFLIFSGAKHSSTLILSEGEKARVVCECVFVCKARVSSAQGCYHLISNETGSNSCRRCTIEINSLFRPRYRLKDL